MLKIKKAGSEEKERLDSLLRRVDASLSKKGFGEIDSRSVALALEEGRLFVLLNRNEILGAYSFTANAKAILFPGDSPRAYFSFLDGLGAEAPLTLLSCLFVDPSLQGKGLGNLMLQDALSARKGTHFVALVDSKNLVASSFLLHHGFLFHHEEKGTAWYVRPYVPQGLCQNVRW